MRLIVAALALSLASCAPVRAEPRDAVAVVSVDAVTHDAPVACAYGLHACGDTCVDLAADVDHCGQCDLACDSHSHAPATCSAGVCTLVCEAGAVDCNVDPTDGCESTVDACVYDPTAQFVVHATGGIWQYAYEHVGACVAPLALRAGRDGLDEWVVPPPAGLTPCGAVDVAIYRELPGTMVAGIPPGVVGLRPGADACALLEWVAPRTGTYDVALHFTPRNAGTADVRVGVWGSRELCRGSIDGADSRVDCVLRTALTAGDRVTIRVGPRAAGATEIAADDVLLAGRITVAGM